MNITIDLISLVAYGLVLLLFEGLIIIAWLVGRK